MKLLLSLALAASVFGAGNAYITVTATNLNYTVPASGSYLNAISDVRLEYRVLMVNCNQSGLNYDAVLSFKNTGLGWTCVTNGSTNIGMYNGNVATTVNATFVAGTWYTFRDERVWLTSTTSTHRLSWWKYDGTGYGTQTINMDALVASSPTNAAGAKSLIRNVVPGYNFAWVRVYSSVLPAGSGMPTEAGSTTNLIHKWMLDGSLVDSAGAMNLTASGSAATYTSAPDAPYTVTVSISAQTPTAGESFVLDGSGAFRWDMAPITSYVWQVTAGPNQPEMSSHSVVSPTVSSALAGDYTFKLIADGVQASTTLSVRNLDSDGFDILASNQRYSTIPVTAKATDVTGATSMEIRTMKPDGRPFDWVACTADACSARVDTDQKHHQYQIRYKKTGNVVATSEWTHLTHTQATRATSDTLDRVYIKLWGLGVGNTGSVPIDTIGKFLSNKTNTFSTGGQSTILAFNPLATLPVYSDMVAAYLTELYAQRVIGAAHSYLNTENFYLHQQVDYITASNRIWSKPTKFDYGESTSVNGVLIDRAGVFTDETVDAYSLVAVTGTLGVADVPLLTGDKLMIGCVDPFDEINFDLSTMASGSTITWEYWNGTTWTALTLRSDTTNTGSQSLGQDGKVLFTPPGDWATVTGGGGTHPKYWVRITVSGGTTPIITQILGDDWLNTAEVTKLVQTGTASVYTDVTTAALNSTNSDVTITSQLVVGYPIKFESINWYLNTPAVGATITWEYWNGSAWTALTVAGNTGMTTAISSVTFTPPVAWTKSIINTSENKYWVRITRSGGTAPVARQIAGPSWAHGSISTSSTTQTATPISTYLRGWDDTNCTTNCSTTYLKYNLNAATGVYDGNTSTARFKHQGRHLGIWTNDNFFFNTKNAENGELTTSRINVDVKYGLFDNIHGNGIMMDNIHGVPTMGGPSTWRGYNEQNDAFFASNVANYQAVGVYGRSLYGANWVLSGNGTYWDETKYGNQFYEEHFRFVDNSPQLFGLVPHTTLYPGTPQATGLADNESWKSSGNPQQLDPTNNPDGVKGWISIWDTSEPEYLSGDGTFLVIWDRVNRSPITGLASYYISMNANTRFFYLTDGGFIYRGLDDFEYADTTVAHTTTTALGPSLTTTAKTVDGDFSSLSTGVTYSFRLGSPTSGDWIGFTKVDNDTITTSEVINGTYPIGTSLYALLTGRMATGALPAADRMKRWRQYFPAMNIDIGDPDTVTGTVGDNGVAGFRKMIWQRATNAIASKTIGNIQRRDFTKAITLFNSAAGVANADQYMLNTYTTCTDAALVCAANYYLLGATYYPLQANGTTAAGIDRIRLRAAEGAILMKEPVY